MNKKVYDEEFKRNAVELLMTQGKPLKTLAMELGMSDAALRNWRDRYLAKAEASSNGDPPPRDMMGENRRLRRDLERVTRQREILKKALSILSDPLPGGMP